MRSKSTKTRSSKGQRILIVDDLLATGGTAVATAELASGLGAQIAGLAFVVELDFLKGRERLGEVRCVLAAALRSLTIDSTIGNYLASDFGSRRCPVPSTAIPSILTKLLRPVFHGE